MENDIIEQEYLDYLTKLEENIDNSNWDMYHKYWSIEIISLLKTDVDCDTITPDYKSYINVNYFYNLVDYWTNLRDTSFVWERIYNSLLDSMSQYYC